MVWSMQPTKSHFFAEGVILPDVLIQVEGWLSAGYDV
jgi:hypothetical protein